MMSIRSSHKLPGENGLHARDGSLTKRKQEQWERERVENEQTDGWFAKFGQKHTPGRRRAVNWTASNNGGEGEDSSMEEGPNNNGTTRNGEEERHNGPSHRQQNAATNGGIIARQEHVQQQPTMGIGIESLPTGHPLTPLVPPAAPPSIASTMLYGTPTAFPMAPPPSLPFFATPPPVAQPMQFFAEYQAQCQRQFNSGTVPMFSQYAQMPQVIDTAAFILAAHQQPKFQFGMPQQPLMPTPPFSCTSSLEEAGDNNSPAALEHQQQHHHHHHQQQQQNGATVITIGDTTVTNGNNECATVLCPVVDIAQRNNSDGTALLCAQSPPAAEGAEMGSSNHYNNSNNKANCVRRSPARRSLSMDASGTWEEELARQVAERQLSTAREAQKALEEERVREKEERECRAREQAEREAEERRRMDRIEARDQTERSTLASLQRAQREAELLRRAKLFRHILLDGDGQADMDTARRVLKCGPEEEPVLNDVIRQLREFDRQKRLGNESCGSLSPSTATGKATPKGAKDATAKGTTGGRMTPSPAALPFCRANSLNVKHSRTMHGDFYSPIAGQRAKVPSPVIAQTSGIFTQQTNSAPPKATKTAGKERRNAIIHTTKATPAHSPPHVGNATVVISPGTTVSSPGAYGGGSESEKSTPDKKSFRQKVQNAVRNGAAAMLRRRESGSSKTTTAPNGGTAKVLRTVGLFEQVTLRHRTASSGSGGNKQKQEQQQQQLSQLNPNSAANNHHPSSSSSQPSAASLSVYSPTRTDNDDNTNNNRTNHSSGTQQQQLQQQQRPTTQEETTTSALLLYSSAASHQPIQFLLPPPPPLGADDTRRRRPRQIEATTTTTTLSSTSNNGIMTLMNNTNNFVMASAANGAAKEGEEKEGGNKQQQKMKPKQQQQQQLLKRVIQFEGEEEEEENFSSNGEECQESENGRHNGGTVATPKCHQNGRENGAEKTTAAQQNSPPGSSSATSSSSASVLRFRAALDSPFGSREDISNMWTKAAPANGCAAAAAFPPVPPKFLGVLRHANGAAGADASVVAAHSLLPQQQQQQQQHLAAPPPSSPFRRAVCGGDSSEPLVRRSLRSPTMRRLQESLQSLAEDAPMSLVAPPAGDGVVRAETPKAFNCRTSQYRSLNLKRETERQKQILEHLSNVRSQLKNRQVQIERTFGRQQRQNDVVEAEERK